MFALTLLVTLPQMMTLNPASALPPVISLALALNPNVAMAPTQPNYNPAMIMNLPPLYPQQ